MTESGWKPWQCVSHCGNDKWSFFSQVNLFSSAKGIFLLRNHKFQISFSSRKLTLWKMWQWFWLLQNAVIVSMSYCSRSKLMCVCVFGRVVVWVFIFNLLASKGKGKMISSGGKLQCRNACFWIIYSSQSLWETNFLLLALLIRRDQLWSKVEDNGKRREGWSFPSQLLYKKWQHCSANSAFRPKIPPSSPSPSLQPKPLVGWLNGHCRSDPGHSRASLPFLEVSPSPSPSLASLHQVLGFCPCSLSHPSSTAGLKDQTRTPACQGQPWHLEGSTQPTAVLPQFHGLHTYGQAEYSCSRKKHGVSSKSQKSKFWKMSLCWMWGGDILKGVTYTRKQVYKDTPTCAHRQTHRKRLWNPSMGFFYPHTHFLLAL